MAKFLYLFKLSVRYMKLRMFASVVSICAIAISLLFLTVIGAANFSLKKSASESSIKYPLILGSAKSSATQLVMSTLFHLDKPAGTIPFEIMDELIKDPKVSAAYPIALADSVGSYPIIGTDENYLKQLSSKILEGEINLSNLENGVLGFEAAEKTGLKIGDTFKGSHGTVTTEGAHEHGEITYKVVGILGKTNSPEDSAIYINYKAVWFVHKEHKEEEHHENVDDKEHLKHGEENNEQKHRECEKYAEHHPENIDENKHHEHKESDHENHLTEGKLTAILVKTRNPAFTAQLEQNYSAQSGIQAADTGRTVRRMINYMNKAEKVVTVFNTITILLISAMILVTMMMSLNERKKELALMRAIGIGRFSIAMLAMIESFIVTTIGVLAGIFSGHALIWWAKNLIDSKLGVAIEPTTFTSLELNGVIITILAGQLVALTGMIQIYRMNLTEELSKE